MTVRTEPVEVRSSYSLREGYAHDQFRTNGKIFKMRIAEAEAFLLDASAFCYIMPPASSMPQQRLCQTPRISAAFSVQLLQS